MSLQHVSGAKVKLASAFVASAALAVGIGFFTDANVAIVDEGAADSLEKRTEQNATTNKRDVMHAWETFREVHSAEGLRAWYEACQDIEDPARRIIFREAVLAEWIAQTPNEALTYFQEIEEGWNVNRILTLWIKTNPKAAVEAMKTVDSKWGSFIGNLLGSVAEKVPEALGELAPLASAGRRGSYHFRIVEAFAMAARNDLEAIVRTVSAMEGPGRNEALSGVAMAWGEKNPEGGLAWVDTLTTDGERTAALRGLLSGWAKTNPVEALDHLHLAPAQTAVNSLRDGPNSLRDGPSVIDAILQYAVQADFQGTLKWLGEHEDQVDTESTPWKLLLIIPFEAHLDKLFTMVYEGEGGVILHDTLKYYIERTGKENQEKLWEWSNQQAESENSRSLREMAIVSATSRSPELALDWARELMDKGESETLPAKILAERLINNITDYQKLEWLLADADPEVQIETLTRALTRSSREEMGHEEWSGWLNQLPMEAQSEVVQSEAGRLAKTDPIQASEWADGLPEVSRSSAYAGIAKSWLSADSEKAAEWIGSLPSGVERDVAAFTLVDGIFKKDPETAWVWAQSIETDEQRMEAIQKVLNQFGERASEVLADSNLSDDEKLEIEAQLHSN